MDRLSTLLNHPPKSKVSSQNVPAISPIYQTAKFSIDLESPLADQYLYTRVSNPTLRELELTLAEVQGEEDAIVYASGLAAITHSLLGLLSAGDHLLFFREMYRPARVFISGLSRFGIESTMLSLGDWESLEKSFRPGKTKVLYFESPTNPNLLVADIPKLRDFCQRHQILLVMDNTFAGPHQHHGQGIDLFIHSLTKFVNGHGDVIAGAVMGRSDLIKKIKPMAIALGATLDPHAAFLIQRGLRTYELRYKRQTESAQKLVAYLRSHLNVKKVYYPEGELADSLLIDKGAIVSLELDPAAGTAKDFCRKLSLIQTAVSLGSAETLINPTEMFFGDDLSAQNRLEMGLNSHSLRISVGLEDARDLIEDLEQAFK